MTETKMTPGAMLLKDWLSRHRLKQNDLAVRVGTSQATISKLLKGTTRPGLALAQLIEQATHFASPDDRDTVVPVPMLAWLSNEEDSTLTELQRIKDEVAGRALEDQQAQFWAEVEQKLDQTLAQQDREIEALSQATDATSREIIFDKITVIKGAIESYERWLKK